ncbi:MAG: glycosyltransferase 87 family protein [Eubacteriales bacterium]
MENKNYTFILTTLAFLFIVLTIALAFFYTYLTVIITIAAVTILYIIFTILKPNKSNFYPDDEKRIKYLLISSTVFIVIIKLIVSSISPGFETDVACFKSWADYAYTLGPAKLYTSGLFIDYPPGYVYVLYVIGFIKNVFSIDYTSGLYGVLIRLPAIIADVTIVYFVYKIAKKNNSLKIAASLGILALLNPAFYINGAVWGQVDAVFTLALVFTFYLLTQKKMAFAAIFYGVSILIKPQALLIGPVFALPYLKDIFSKQTYKKGLKTAAVSVVASLATIFLLALPFQGEQGTFWIVRRILATIGQSQAASYNIFNFFSMFDANYQSFDKILFIFSYQVWGYIFIIAAFVMGYIIYFKNKGKVNIFLIVAFVYILETMFGHSMRERYILPGIMFLLFAYASTKDADKNILIVFNLFTATASINELVVLYYYAQETLYYISTAIMVTFSVINVLISVYLIYTVFKISNNKRLSLEVQDINEYGKSS